MYPEQWLKPVTIEVGNVTHLVVTSSQACQLLLERWPGGQTILHRTARLACVAALEDGDMETCRKLFIEAAREAGVLKE